MTDLIGTVELVKLLFFLFNRHHGLIPFLIVNLFFPLLY